MSSHKNLVLPVIAILFVVLGSLFVRMVLGNPGTGIDDADIFFVYARNFSEGHGFVYNVGGETVEGFTSLLWTLICSLFFRFTDNPELSLYILSILIGALTLNSTLRRTEHKWIFIALLACVPGWFVWCQVTLMETGLWCLIITLTGLALAERSPLSVALLLPLMILTRPESMLWGAWVILLLTVFSEKGARIKAVIPAVLSYAVTLLALIAFRLSYFGYPVPNTYYAKVSGSLPENVISGLAYLLQYVVSHPLVLVIIGLLLFLSISLLRSPVKEWRFEDRLALFLLPGIGIPVLVGGDHFGAFRFYQPLWPLLCLMAMLYWPALMQKCRPIVAYSVLGGCLIYGWILFPLTGNLKHEFRIAEEGRGNGATLVQMFSDLHVLPTVATITAGGNKYGYPGHVFDLMGLNSTQMAHVPGSRGGYKNHTGFNSAVFYRWEPDILLCGDSEEFDLLVLNGLQKEPRFSVSYIKCVLHRNGVQMNAWFKNDFLMSLPGTGAPIIPEPVLDE